MHTCILINVMIWSTLSCLAQTFGSTLMTHWAGRCEAIWVTISQGNDSRPLASGEGELRSEWSSGGGLEDTWRRAINLFTKRSDVEYLSLKTFVPLRSRAGCFTVQRRGWIVCCTILFLGSIWNCFLQVSEVRHHRFSWTANSTEDQQLMHCHQNKTIKFHTVPALWNSHLAPDLAEISLFIYVFLVGHYLLNVSQSFKRIGNIKRKAK